MGYLRFSDVLCEKHYNPEGVIVLGKTHHQVEYDEMLTSLQALAIMPFQLGFDFVAEKHAKSVQTSPSRNVAQNTTSNSVESPTGTASANQQDPLAPNKPPRKAPTGITSKAWDWLKGTPEPQPVDHSPEGPTTPRGNNSMITSLTGMIGKLTGWDSNHGDYQGEEPKMQIPSCPANQPIDEQNGNVAVIQTSDGFVGHETPKSPDQNQPIIRRPVVKSSSVDCVEMSPRSKAQAVLDRNRVKAIKSPDSDSKSRIPSKLPVVETRVSLKEPRQPIMGLNTGADSKVKVNLDEDDVTPTNAEKTMIESVSDIAHKLLGMGPPKEKPVYTKGVTEHKLDSANETKVQVKNQTKGQDKPEVLTECPTPKKPQSPEFTQLTPPQSPDRESNPSNSSSKSDLGSSLGSSGERPKNLPLKGKIPVRQNTSPPKQRSGLIKLFDKLLLPRENTSTNGQSQGQKQQPKGEGQSIPPAQPVKSRWSWGGRNSSKASTSQNTTAKASANQNTASKVTTNQNSSSKVTSQNPAVKATSQNNSSKIPASGVPLSQGQTDTDKHRGARPKSVCLPPNTTDELAGASTKKRSISSDNLKKRSQNETKNVNASPVSKIQILGNLLGGHANVQETVVCQSGKVFCN